MGFHGDGLAMRTTFGRFEFLPMEACRLTEVIIFRHYYACVCVCECQESRMPAHRGSVDLCFTFILFLSLAGGCYFTRRKDDRRHGLRGQW